MKPLDMDAAERDPVYGLIDRWLKILALDDVLALKLGQYNTIMRLTDGTVRLTAHPMAAIPYDLYEETRRYRHTVRRHVGNEYAMGMFYEMSGSQVTVQRWEAVRS